MKRILLLSTGGTIASRPGSDGLEPELSGEELIAGLGDLRGKYEIQARQILNLDSSNIGAEEWQMMARAIFAQIGDFDGVIITHGTDTMAYTASALSFMLPGLDRPVVLTGSQMPMDNMLTDARNNLFCALAAVDAGIWGVSVAFNRHIIRGCRAVKVRTMGFDAFESVNARYLGELFADGLRVYSREDTPGGTELRLRDRLSTDVFLLKFIPNTSPRVFEMIREAGYRGVVLETFGAGGLPSRQEALTAALRDLTDRGVVTVACSQCLYEPSNLMIYEVGRRLLDAGAVPAGDMTTEAAVTKLMWALGQTGDPGEVRRLFSTNLCGEISQNV